MDSRYENIPLPSQMVRAIDFIVKKYNYNSRPEFLKDLVRQHIEELVKIKLLMPDEIRPFYKS
jgi:metal-responsive CopG/Arc/MetJ family transcriptional regulator